MQVRFSNNFYKDLLKLNNPHLKKEVKNFIQILESNTTILDIPNIKKLKLQKSAYRYRIGNFRIGFYSEGDTILIKRVALRKDFYRIFPFLFL